MGQDWTGKDWRALPNWVVKAARSGAAKGHTIIGKAMCIRCKRDIWQTDEKENMCEECEYTQRRDNWDLRIERDKRNARQANMTANPFSDESAGGMQIFWPRDE